MMKRMILPYFEMKKVFGTSELLRDAAEAGQVRRVGQVGRIECCAWACVLLWLALAAAPARAAESVVPDWAADAVWYQIFPERFRDGDPANNPTRDSLVWPIGPSEKWAVRPWGSDWYERADWEKAMDRPADAKASRAERFYKNGILDRRYGGDLQGVLDKLDYLKELGVTAIYFNPVFYARSLHKYDGNSFHHIDPYFGPDPKGDFALMEKETADPATWHWTAADKLFLKLVREAKARGIRVVIDGVFNHTGRDFFAFEDLRKNQEKSPYRDWYRVAEFDNPATTRNEFEYKGWWGYKSLPVFAATPDGKNMNEGPKNYIFAATKRWMDPDGDGDPSDGIDGWRLDVADELPPEFWADWHRVVHEVNPQAYTTAEVWSNPLELIEYGGFSAAMNYHGFAIPVKGFLVDRHIRPSKFAEMMDSRRAALPRPVAEAMMNLIDSHDTDRVASMIANGEKIHYDDPNHIAYNSHASPRSNEHYEIGKLDARGQAILRMVVLLQMTSAGAPMSFYGTEAGIWGAGDPDCRKPMIWPDIQYAPEATDPRRDGRKPDEVKFDQALYDFFKSAIALRKEHAVLRRGETRTIGTFDDQWVYVFERFNNDGALVVAFNRSDSEQTVRVRPGAETAEKLGASPRVIFETGFGFGKAACALRGGELEIQLPPLSGVVIAGK